MPIELRVEPRIQTSPYSCWWACMAMVLQYYGSYYAFPWDYRMEFANQRLTPPSYFPRQRYPNIDQYLDAPEATRAHFIHSQPYEWFYSGVPPLSSSLSLLSDITGFRGLTVRPNFGYWTLAHVELMIRTCGPLLLFGTYAGGRRHAILIIGAIINQAIGVDQIIYIDPANGMAIHQDLAEFNEWVRTFTSEWVFSRLNPVYLPTSNPVQATISLI